MSKKKSAIIFLEVIYKNSQGKQITAEFETDLPFKQAVTWARREVQSRATEIIDIFQLEEPDEVKDDD